MASLKINLDLNTSTSGSPRTYQEKNEDNMDSTIDMSVKKYVDSVYPLYIPDLTVFQQVANNARFSDDCKLGQLSIFIGEIAAKMANQYPEKVEENDKLVYDIALALAADSRICRIVGVARGIWDKLPEVADYLDLVAFNTMLAIDRASANLRSFTKVGCLCFTRNVLEIVEASSSNTNATTSTKTSA
jgi:hypothetical protein